MRLISLILKTSLTLLSHFSIVGRSRPCVIFSNFNLIYLRGFFAILYSYNLSLNVKVSIEEYNFDFITKVQINYYQFLIIDPF